MIFATTGSQMPFDRLIRALDEWAARQSATPDVIAQIGESLFRPKYLRSVTTLTAVEFRQTVSRARLVVSHAGMGSVITALEFAKPLVIMPRLGQLRETRNDHQIATAKWLAAKPGIFVAMSETDLAEAMCAAEACAERLPELSQTASDELISVLTAFIAE